MPHLKIKGALDLERLFADLTPLEVRDDAGVQKVESFYLEQNRELILAEALVIDVGRPRRFFISIKPRSAEETVIRVLPITDLEKTEGVKRVIARLGLRVIDLCPGVEVGHTNLEEQIAAVSGDADRRD